MSKPLIPLSTLSPPSQDRAWQTSPHPTLPIAATCGADKTVRIYSLTNYKLLSTISGGHKRSVRCTAWKPNSGVTSRNGSGESVIATASFDATVGVWRGYGGGRDGGFEEEDMGREEGDEDEWTFSVLLDGHENEVKSLSWSPSSSLLATSSRDKSIWIWEDLEDGDDNFETVAVLQEHEGDVKCVVWHPEEECLASASYDETIRLWREDGDDWGEVCCLKGHEGTVWAVDWEAPPSTTIHVPSGLTDTSATEKWNDRRRREGPRLVSCSADLTLRVWRKIVKDNALPAQNPTTGPRVPSIIRPAGLEETWIEEAELPIRHDRAIYSVAWSKKSGLIASTGGDGRIVVYAERAVAASDAMDTREAGDAVPADEEEGRTKTEWVVIREIEAAHDIYEVNHVCWARRADRKGGESEEVLLSTGDDGAVRVWGLDE